MKVMKAMKTLILCILSVQRLLSCIVLTLLAYGNVNGANLIRNLGDQDFGVLAMPRNDDKSSSAIDLKPIFPNGLNLFGQTHSVLYINNNGNITFNEALSGYTPDAFPVTNRPMIAPFWGDVDSRGQTDTDTKNNVYYSTALAGKLVVTWYEIGYYSAMTNKLNSFQLILTDRSDRTPGDFDVEFLYEKLEWTTGNSSGGQDGLGGTPAQTGFDAGDGVNFYQHPDSQTNRILDLVTGTNIDSPGIWRFAVRDGNIEPPQIVEFSAQGEGNGTTAVLDWQHYDESTSLRGIAAYRVY